jgi:hypothetical protein
MFTTLPARQSAATSAHGSSASSLLASIAQARTARSSSSRQSAPKAAFAAGGSSGGGRAKHRVGDAQRKKQQLQHQQQQQQPQQEKRRDRPAPAKFTGGGGSDALACEHFQLCSGCSLDTALASPPLYHAARDYFVSKGLDAFPMVAGPMHGWRCRAKLAVRGTPGRPLIGGWPMLNAGRELGCMWCLMPSACKRIWQQLETSRCMRS